MPKPLPWLPNLLHRYGLDIPNQNDGSNLHFPNPDLAEGKGVDWEGEGEEGDDRVVVAQDKKR